MNISKNLLWVSIALIAIAGIAFAAFDTNSPWHDLANIATDSTGTVSIDSSPQNNIIDRANVAETGPLCTPTAPCGFESAWFAGPQTCHPITGICSPEKVVLHHNLGGNPDDYVIFISCRDGDYSGAGVVGDGSVILWSDLNSTDISVQDPDAAETNNRCGQLKLNMWRYS